MANRVTDPEVRSLIPNTSIADLTPFINAANSLVNRLESSDCGAELSDDDLTQIELWLSAHYAAVTDPMLAVKVEKFENASNTYSRGSTDMSGIMSTQYGQMANSLSGSCLIEFDMRKASFFSVGGDEC